MNHENTFPGWALRAALLVAAAGALVTAFVGAPQAGPTTIIGAVMILLAAGTAAAPGSVTALPFLAGLVAYRVAAHGPSIDVGLALLVLLLPVIHQLAGIAGLIPVRSKCRWAVLRPAALRLAIAVVPTELALVVTALVLAV